MIAKETIEQIAELSRLDFSDEEKEAFAEQFGKIVDYVNVINSINLDDVEPLSHVIDLENVFREDEIEASLSLKEALSNAPKHNESFYKVPKVLG